MRLGLCLLVKQSGCLEFLGPKLRSKHKAFSGLDIFSETGMQSACLIENLGE